MLRRWGNTVILLQQSLFDTWNTSQGLIPRVSNTAVLSCLPPCHTESASVWNAEGCDKAGVVWRPGMRTCLKFKISLVKLGVLLMLLMSYFQRGLTWWVAVRQRAWRAKSVFDLNWIHSQSHRETGVRAIICNTDWRHTCGSSEHWWDDEERRVWLKRARENPRPLMM